MNQECFAVLPPPATVIEISKRYRGIVFVRGFCRSVVMAGGYMAFLGGFRLCSDPNLTSCWAEPCELDVALLNGASFEIVKETGWMRRTSPPGVEFLTEEPE